MKDGGSAYPTYGHNVGQSLRDAIAMQVTIGMIAAYAQSHKLLDYDAIADMAYETANAMIRRRERQ